MRYTIRRLVFGILTTPLILGGYTLLVFVLGGDQEMVFSATPSVAIGWIVSMLFVPSLLRKWRV